MRLNVGQWTQDHLRYNKLYKQQNRSKALSLFYPLILCIILLCITIYLYAENLQTTTQQQSLPPNLSNITNPFHSITHQNDPNYKLADELYPDHGGSETIFIAIASYRDPECVKSILNLFETAKYPDRIRFGLFQQNNITDIDCMDFHRHIDCNKKSQRHPICGRMWQIKIDREHYLDAKGPMYGRYRTELYYDNEDYFMQIDAHTRMVPYWDNICIEMFKRVNNSKAVFTTYPKAVRFDNDWKPPVPKDTDNVVVIPQSKMTSGGHMFKHERGIDSRNPGKSVISVFFAAGFSFQSGKRILDVPSDPYLPYLFDGEETSMGIRMWTHGYDMYTPIFDIVYHIYSMKMKKGETRHLFWELKNRDRYRRKAEYRVLYLLKLFDSYVPNNHGAKYDIDLREIDKYGLGTERAIETYWKWVGMDWAKLETQNLRMKILNGELKRIPTYSELEVLE